MKKIIIVFTLLIPQIQLQPQPQPQTQPQTTTTQHVMMILGIYY